MDPYSYTCPTCNRELTWDQVQKEIHSTFDGWGWENIHAEEFCKPGWGNNSGQNNIASILGSN